MNNLNKYLLIKEQVANRMTIFKSFYKTDKQQKNTVTTGHKKNLNKSGFLYRNKTNYDLDSAFLEAQQAFFSPVEHSFFSAAAFSVFAFFFSLFFGSPAIASIEMKNAATANNETNFFMV